MTDDIKKALEICLTDESCEPCVYLNDPDCDRKLKADAYQLICSQENTIKYLMDLNKKLSTELQQTKLLACDYCGWNPEAKILKKSEGENE